MPKILFIQTSFLGDVILSTALIEKWKQHYPNDVVDVLVRKGNEGVFNDNPKLRNIIIWDKKHAKYKNLLSKLKEIRSHAYDKVFNLQRFASTGLLTVLSGAKETIGFDKNPFSSFYTKKHPHVISSKEHVHETQRNQNLIAEYTDSIPAKPKIYTNSQSKLRIETLVKKPYIVIAPASVWFTKQYPKSRWISFLSKLKNDIEVVFIGSKADQKLCAEIIVEAGLKNQNLKMQNLCGELSIQESAELMKHAVMNYVNDSAPLHIASSVNAPVAAIFCSTVTEFGFGPLSDVQHIIQIQQELYCRPCGLHGYKKCPEKHFRCAFEIEDKQLHHVLDSVFL
jgi:ADP-heptose:LPS heptosyltransferase